MTDAAKFEVGKKYRGQKGQIVECLFVGKEKIFCRWSDGTEGVFLPVELYWTEVREPQTLVGFVNVWSDDGGVLVFGKRVYSTEDDARNYMGSSKSFAIHRIEYTEPTEGSSS